MSKPNHHNPSAITRRAFAAALGASAFACRSEAARPNILWITCEDIGPHIGAYGDKFADTPNLDKFAAKSLTYLNAWSNAPVCAPARTTIISGLYPPSTGSEHMRSLTRPPASMKMYPNYLREAGYYASNNVKTDYNLEETGQVWDESSKEAHWRKRAPGQPFFAIFNFTITHESQIRTRPHTLVHDPSKVRIPAYHPDTPEVRHDWTQYYDNITTMDGQAGEVLKQLEEDGLTEDTIVFFYGDHGSGMPRSKRWPYNSGLQVPFLVHVPEKYRNLAPKDYKPGGRTNRLVGFIDLAPTVLSLAGVEPPAYMQGHAMMGAHEAPEQPYLYGFRGRMDERYDMVRSVRDQRYIYIRNYMPHKIFGQRIPYMFQTPTTQVWKQLYDEGKLEPPKTYFWETKQPEELYDLQSDPDEVNNLAGSAEHQEILARLRKAQQDWEVEIRDVGFLPESEIHSRSEGSTPYEMGHDDAKYPLEKIMATAEMASMLKPEVLDDLVERLENPDSAVRYWAAMGILMRGKDAVTGQKAALDKALEDESPNVRIIAAEALGRYGSAADTKKAIGVLLDLASPEKTGPFVSLLALNGLDALGKEKIGPLKEKINALPRTAPGVPDRVAQYSGRLIDDMVAQL